MPGWKRGQDERDRAIAYARSRRVGVRADVRAGAVTGVAEPLCEAMRRECGAQERTRTSTPRGAST